MSERDWRVFLATQAIRRQQAEQTLARLQADYEAAGSACDAATRARIAAEQVGDWDRANLLLGVEMAAWEAQNARAVERDAARVWACEVVC